MKKMDITKIFNKNPFVLKGLLSVADSNEQADTRTLGLNFISSYNYLSVTAAINEASYAVITFDLTKSTYLSDVKIETFKIQQTSALLCKPNMLVSLHNIKVKEVSKKYQDLAEIITDITSQQEIIDYLFDYMKTDESSINVLDYETVDFKRAKGAPHHSFDNITHNGYRASDYIDNKGDIPIQNQQKVISKVLALIAGVGDGYQLNVETDKKGRKRYLLLSNDTLLETYSIDELQIDSIILKRIVADVTQSQESSLKDNKRCVKLEWIKGDYRTDYQPRKYSIGIDPRILAGSLVVDIPDNVNMGMTKDVYLSEYTNVKVQEAEPIFLKDGDRLRIINDKDSHYPVLASHDLKTLIPLKVVPNTEIVLTNYN